MKRLHIHVAVDDLGQSLRCSPCRQRSKSHLFLSLPLASIDKMALGTKLREIGRIESASSHRPDVA